MSKLGIGVVGVGEMGIRHAENARRSVRNATLVAVADANAARARFVADELEIEHWYDSVEAMVERSDIQAVVICSPPRIHVQTIKAVAARGKHILCEKPLALTTSECDEALDAVAKAGIFFQVAHMRRYDPAYAAAQKRIEGGEIGDPVMFRSLGRDAHPGPTLKPASEGTLLLESAVHEFDLARWMMRDEVAEVHTYTACKSVPELAKLGAYDSSVVNLRYARGAIGNIESFINAQYGYDIRTEVLGTKGAVQIGSMSYTPMLTLLKEGSSCDLVQHWLVRFADAYRLELNDFVDSILAGRPPRVSGDDGRRAVALADAAERSGREGRPIRLGGSAG